MLLISRPAEDRRLSLVLKRLNEKTRMVQLPATATIEYVAAGHFFPGSLLPGGLLARVFLPGGTLVRGAYARSPQVQCVYAPSRLSVPSIVA